MAHVVPESELEHVKWVPPPQYRWHITRVTDGVDGPDLVASVSVRGSSRSVDPTTLTEDPLDHWGAIEAEGWVLLADLERALLRSQVSDDASEIARRELREEAVLIQSVASPADFRGTLQRALETSGEDLPYLGELVGAEAVWTDFTQAARATASRIYASLLGSDVEDRAEEGSDESE